MKKLLSATLLCVLGVSAMQARGELKMDSYTRQVADILTVIREHPEAVHVSIPGYRQIGDAVAMSRTSKPVTCLIKLADGVDADRLEQFGLTVTDSGDGIAVAQGPMSAFIAVAGSEYVDNVSLDREVKPCTDFARKDTGIDDIHDGVDLYRGFDGTGVICGLYDHGLDPNHINFYDRAFTRNRVQRLWRFIGSGGVPTGTYTNDNIAEFTTDDTSESHGTHVLGCIAGGFNQRGNSAGTSKPRGSNAMLNSTGTGVTTLASRKNPYYGMAPGADLVIGCGPLYQSNMLTTLSSAITYAESQGKPLVFNLSVGHNSGPHDGTDAFSQRLDELGKRAIIFVAAGNEGDDDFTITRTFTDSETNFKTLLSSADGFSGTIEIWSSNAQPLTVTPVIYDTDTDQILYRYDFNSTGTTAIATAGYTAPGYIHDQNIDRAFTTANIVLTGSDNAGTNRRYSVTVSVNIRYNPTTNADRNLQLGFIVAGKAGQRADLVWLANSGSTQLMAPADGWTAGTPDLSINDMACAKNIICVGSYNTRSSWPAFGGIYSFNDPSGMEAGEISGFSSYGELVDGRRLPTVAAPGNRIISSISSYSTGNGPQQKSQSAYYTYKDRNYPFEGMTGTSMATPIMAGIVATWLQANPDLTVDNVKDILRETCSKGDAQGLALDDTDDIRWGYGKVNAYEGLKAAMKLNAVTDIVADDSDILVKVNGNTFEAFAAGAARMEVKLFDMTGAKVAAAAEAGDTAVLDATHLTPGVYLLNVNGRHTQRVIVR